MVYVCCGSVSVVRVALYCQIKFSDQIRSTILQLRELQDRPDADQGRIDELTNRVEWDTRIFGSAARR